MIRDLISYLLQLLEIKKKKIAVFMSSLQATAASLLPLLQLYGALGKTGKLKEKLEYMHYVFFPSLTPNIFVQEIDILNVNFNSQISFIHKIFTAICSNIRDLLKHK